MVLERVMPAGLDNTSDDPSGRQALIVGNNTYESITEKVCGVVEDPKIDKRWLAMFIVALGGLGMLGALILYLIATGVGVWGNNTPVAWGWPIVNFVFWVGIGHAGTLISAILFLLRQDWRTSINRFAEAMTIFAVVCAGTFPGIHVGRVWLAYWLFPIPNQMAMWPNFRSPLLWDVFAVSTYASVSLVFWYMGMIPDLATIRDRAKHPLRRLGYGLLSLGWRQNSRAWHRYEKAYGILAGLATPLVLSVHTIVSFDFAVSQLPGWHTTIFPPYFVAGAIYAGFAMVLTLMIPLRWMYGLQDFITERHLDNMAKVMLTSGMIVCYGYFMEQFIAWYSASAYEGYMMKNRMVGPYAFYYWALIVCNGVVPQLLWIRKCRISVGWLFFISMFINVGMWLERFIIVVTSLHRDYMPSSWDMYNPTFWDWGLYMGTIGLFIVLFFLFVRGWPLIAIHEIRTLLPMGGKKH